MTPPERARLLRMILDEHDQAMFELRESSNAFDAGISSMRLTLDALQSANTAQGRAIDRVRSAHKVALAPFTADYSPHYRRSAAALNHKVHCKHHDEDGGGGRERPWRVADERHV